ncbi:hypothetical protein GA0070607_5064 [Micromonospora coriariae]|uniref:Uncharacterized protein n=1 Tax=Micromonospora coriariae TaxID=285665 RepID=A0A1C4XCN9_9ACTN|nr:hypothetical protein GA0070607_5064 [Micromonospora coriariae]
MRRPATSALPTLAPVACRSCRSVCRRWRSQSRCGPAEAATEKGRRYKNERLSISACPSSDATSKVSARSRRTKDRELMSRSGASVKPISAKVTAWPSFWLNASAINAGTTPRGRFPCNQWVTADLSYFSVLPWRAPNSFTRRARPAFEQPARSIVSRSLSLDAALTRVTLRPRPVSRIVGRPSRLAQARRRRYLSGPFNPLFNSCTRSSTCAFHVSRFAAAERRSSCAPVSKSRSNLLDQRVGPLVPFPTRAPNVSPVQRRSAGTEPPVLLLSTGLTA